MVLCFNPTFISHDKWSQFSIVDVEFIGSRDSNTTRANLCDSGHVYATTPPHDCIDAGAAACSGEYMHVYAIVRGEDDVVTKLAVGIFRYDGRNMRAGADQFTNFDFFNEEGSTRCGVIDAESQSCTSISCLERGSRVFEPMQGERTSELPIPSLVTTSIECAKLKFSNVSKC